MNKEVMIMKDLEKDSESIKLSSSKKIAELLEKKSQIENIQLISLDKLQNELKEIVDIAKKYNLKIPEKAEPLSNRLNLDTYLKNNTEIVVNH